MTVATIAKPPAQRTANAKRSKKKIVAILPRGESVRNFVYGDALDLVAQEAEVHLISCIPNEDTRQMMANRYDSVNEIKLTGPQHALSYLSVWLWGLVP